MHDLASVKKAIQEWTGATAGPEISFSKPNDEGGPSQISILFFPPSGEPSGVNITWVFTLGLSAGVAPGETRSAELLLTVKGRMSGPDMELTARQLAELAVLPYREGTFFEVGRVFKGRTIHPFTRMNNILIASWGLQGESLPDLDPPVDLLFVVPLFDREAEKVSMSNSQTVVSALELADQNVEDFNRSSVY